MNVKIKELPESLTLNGEDVFPIDRSDDITAKVTIDTFKHYLINFLSRYLADNHTTLLDPTTNTFSVNNVFLPLSGGTMTGMLFLNGSPTDPLHSANKEYIDNKISLSDADTLLNFVLKAGDTMSGPLKVDATAIIKNMLYANGGLSVINNATVAGNLTVTQDATVNKSLNVLQTLDVTGASTFRGAVDLQNNKLTHFTANIKPITLSNAPNNEYTLVSDDNGAILTISGSDPVCKVYCPLGLPVGFNVMIVQNSNSTVYIMPEIDSVGDPTTEVVHIDNHFSIRTRYGICNVVLINPSRFLIAGDLS